MSKQAIAPAIIGVLALAALFEACGLDTWSPRAPFSMDKHPLGSPIFDEPHFMFVAAGALTLAVTVVTLAYRTFAGWLRRR